MQLSKYDPNPLNPVGSHTLSVFLSKLEADDIGREYGQRFELLEVDSHIVLRPCADGTSGSSQIRLTDTKDASKGYRLQFNNSGVPWIERIVEFGKVEAATVNYDKGQIEITLPDRRPPVRKMNRTVTNGHGKVITPPENLNEQIKHCAVRLERLLAIKAADGDVSVSFTGGKLQIEVERRVRESLL